MFKLSFYVCFLYFCLFRKISNQPNKCFLEPSIGDCRAFSNFFFYNSRSNSCEPFIFGGCGGNINRFGTKEDCTKTCINYMN